ncbi:hypothetical protein BS47DRAFT_453456 [Hydnum rufescens UP504]|uniref:Uncharacterized protein n=1 Tax=Hydnum rufescens UP504 TaxID=1448309 RepID=A0A9P6AI84_9AGAM|nr:hypothetical protein BS47DRAFT_453456 [Hydnum rufescens UP504]
MALEEAKAHDLVSSAPLRKPPLDTSPVGLPSVKSPANLKVDIPNSPEILNRIPDSSGPGHAEFLDDDERRNNGTDGAETIKNGAPLMSRQIEFGTMSAPVRDLGTIQIKAETPMNGRLPARMQSNGSHSKSPRTMQSVGPPAPIIRHPSIRSTTKDASSEVSAKISADSTRGDSVKLGTSPTRRFRRPQKLGTSVSRNPSAGRGADAKKIHPLEFRSPSPATDVFGPLARFRRLPWSRVSLVLDDHLYSQLPNKTYHPTKIERPILSLGLPRYPLVNPTARPPARVYSSRLP